MFIKAMKRGKGKSTWCVKKAIKTRTPILLTNSFQKEVYIKIAQELGYDKDAVKFVHCSELLGYAGSFIVDEGQYLLSSLLRDKYGNGDIDYMTVTKGED